MKKLVLLSTLTVLAAFASAQDCCSSMKGAAAGDDAFMAEAQRMAVMAEGKKACCKSTEAVAVVKGEKGCCNAKGEVAKFKVFVAGKGYQFFGCEASATKGRATLAAKGKAVGQVQKVASTVSMR